VLGYTNTVPSRLTYQLQDASIQGSGDLARIRNSPENEASGHANRPTESNTVQQIQIENGGLGSLTLDPSFANQSSPQTTTPSASSIAHRPLPASAFQPFNHVSQQSMSPKDMNFFGDLDMNYFTDFFPEQTGMNLFPDLDTAY
jgi:hypothetical protein